MGHLRRQVKVKALKVGPDPVSAYIIGEFLFTVPSSVSQGIQSRDVMCKDTVRKQLSTGQMSAHIPDTKLAET